MHNDYKLESIMEQDYAAVSCWLSDPVEFEKVCGNAFEYPLSHQTFKLFHSASSQILKSPLFQVYERRGSCWNV